MQMHLFLKMGRWKLTFPEQRPKKAEMVESDSCGHL